MLLAVSITNLAILYSGVLCSSDSINHNSDIGETVTQQTEATRKDAYYVEYRDDYVQYYENSEHSGEENSQGIQVANSSARGSFQSSEDVTSSFEETHSKPNQKSPVHTVGQNKGSQNQGNQFDGTFKNLDGSRHPKNHDDDSSKNRNDDRQRRNYGSTDKYNRYNPEDKSAYTSIEKDGYVQQHGSAQLSCERIVGQYELENTGKESYQQYLGCYSSLSQHENGRLKLKTVRDEYLSKLREKRTTSRGPKAGRFYAIINSQQTKYEVKRRECQSVMNNYGKSTTNDEFSYLDYIDCYNFVNNIKV